MHDIDSTQGESEYMGLEALEPESFEFEFEEEEEFEAEVPFSEFEESELAEELLNVQSEEELEQFLGSLVKKAWRGVKKFAKSKVGRALGGVLKKIAKKALPIAGGALGSFIPIPGVGTDDRTRGRNGAKQCLRDGGSKGWTRQSRSLRSPSVSCAWPVLPLSRRRKLPRISTHDSWRRRRSRRLRGKSLPRSLAR